MGPAITDPTGNTGISSVEFPGLSGTELPGEEEIKESKKIREGLKNEFLNSNRNRLKNLIKKILKK